MDIRDEGLGEMGDIGEWGFGRFVFGLLGIGVWLKRDGLGGDDCLFENGENRLVVGERVLDEVVNG